MIDRIPPQAVDVEQSLLGALLIGGAKTYEQISEHVSEDDFYLSGHKIAFRCIRGLAEKNQPIDILTVHDAVEAINQVEQVGGLGYLGEIANATPSAASAVGYAKIVAEKSRLRRLVECGDAIVSIALSPESKPADVRIDEALSKILHLSESSSNGDEPRHISDVLDSVLTSIEDRMNGRIAAGLKTGFDDIDSMLDGLKGGDLIIVAGRPSMGKTAFALNVAENVSLSGTPTLVFSFEMGDTQLAQRTLSSVSGITGQKIARAEFDEDDFDKMSVAINKLKDSPLVIDENVNLTVSQMRARARRMKRKGGLGLIVIDYLQLMKGAGNNRNEELGDLTRNLKLMARDLNVPIICLSQLSRKVEERSDKRPMLSDLRESGAIEQDADVVMMVYRDDYYEPDSDWKGMAEILVRKNRMGACGDAKLIFQAECSRFKNADKATIASIASNQKPVLRRRGFNGL